jgi:phosphoribosylformylglycinamidine synthase
MPTVYRFEVFPKPGHADPIGASVAREATAVLGPGGAIEAAAKHVYLVQGELSGEQRRAIADRILADPVTEAVVEGVSPVAPGVRVVEVHPLPGVMDPVAMSVELAIRDVAGAGVQVMTGWRYDLSRVDERGAKVLAERLLANPVIQRVTTEPYLPAKFPQGTSHDGGSRTVPIIGLSTDALTKLSREAHLFLSLDEMQAIQAHYAKLGREPREIELETLAQTWSEHCVHKTLKSTVRYAATGPLDAVARRQRPGTSTNADGTLTISNLLKHTVAAATFELINEGVDWTLSVFKDNSGVIAFDEQWGVCIKVETHNRPSAIEPYGGAATGIGGCIRDVIGTGLGAKPIASTDVFCVAEPTMPASDLPPGTLHPRRILTQVVAGVRDYGNRMGIPTVSGAVAFDRRYVGNPLVFAGCIGLIPRHLVKGQAKAGDRIIALGGRTGRDGVHGATFSSAQLEQNAADEFGHAVQIGNAITEKQLLDAVLRARDYRHADGRIAPLYSGMTDCGAGGFSSAVGEMGSSLGAHVQLERAPLKYAGLSPTEIWISEAQERMVLAVPPGHVEALRAICIEEGVDIADLGHFGTDGHELILTYHGAEVGRLSMHLLHDGIPMPTREAMWTPPAPSVHAKPQPSIASEPRSLKDTLLAVLAHPTVASKHWIVRQYDHEVQGRSVVKPLVGPAQRGPSDASVIEPVIGSGRGLAIACGLQTGTGDPAEAGDPYQMALAGIDECVRNLVCVGTDPSRIAILDNFCWPSCAKPGNMAALVRACWGCYDGAKAYRTPFVSGKDSLNNQLVYTDPATGQSRTIEIPFTLLISGMGIVPSLEQIVTMDAKRAGSTLIHVGRVPRSLAGSIVSAMGLTGTQTTPPEVDLTLGPATARAVAGLIAGRVGIRAAHDVSDGGVLACVAEMLIAGSAPGAPLGATLDLAALRGSQPGPQPTPSQGPADAWHAAFSEGPSRYVLEVAPADEARVLTTLAAAGVPAQRLGQVNASGVLMAQPSAHTAPHAGSARGDDLSVVVGDLAAAWRGPLDW